MKFIANDAAFRDQLFGNFGTSFILAHGYHSFFEVGFGMRVYGLWPIDLDQLVSRTGRNYSFLIATVVAPDADEARRHAKAQDHMGLPWDDPDKFRCETVATLGDLPPEGRVLYQWTPA
jgi:hypothetical protein